MGWQHKKFNVRLNLLKAFTDCRISQANWHSTGVKSSILKSIHKQSNKSLGSNCDDM